MIGIDGIADAGISGENQTIYPPLIPLFQRGTIDFPYKNDW